MSTAGVRLCAKIPSALRIKDAVVLEVTIPDEEPVKCGGEVKRVLRSDNSVFVWFEMWETGKILKARFDLNEQQSNESVEEKPCSLEHSLQVMLLDSIEEVKALPREERIRALSVLREAVSEIETSLEKERHRPRPTLLSEYVKKRK